MADTARCHGARSAWLVGVAGGGYWCLAKSRPGSFGRTRPGRGFATEVAAAARGLPVVLAVESWSLPGLQPFEGQACAGSAAVQARRGARPRWDGAGLARRR
jgi:hypothetical protein